MDTGVLTFGQIASHAANFVQEPSTNFYSLLKESINDELSLAAQRMYWPQLFAYYNNDISLAAGVPRFYCPPDVLEPLDLIDNTGGNRITPAGLRELFFNFAQTYNTPSAPQFWSTIGDSAILTDFSDTPEKIQIASSSSADTSKAIRVLYQDSNGVLLDESISTDASNGTTAVQSTATMAGIRRISTSSTRVGVITISGVTSGTVYARIGPREDMSLYKVIHLLWPPDGPKTATLLYKRCPSKLKNDDDIPEIPVAQYLRKKAVAFSLSWMGKAQEAAIKLAEADSDLDAHISSNRDPSKSVIQSRPSTPPRIYRTGGWRSG